MTVPATVIDPAKASLIPVVANTPVTTTANPNASPQEPVRLCDFFLRKVCCGLSGVRCVAGVPAAGVPACGGRQRRRRCWRQH